MAVVLVDDASQDGTREAVSARFPDVHIVEGGGDLYWGGGMRIAHRSLTDFSEPNFLMWLNDDVILFREAIEMLLKASVRQQTVVVVGALMDPQTKETSYSGFSRTGRSPLGLSLVAPKTGQTVDTFNGNVLLLSRTAYRLLGSVDAAFPHMYGDLDYGYRARDLAIPIRVADKHVGWCQRNDGLKTWRDQDLSRGRRLQNLHSVKVMPLRPNCEFLRRHGGLEWPIRLLGGYLKAYLRILGPAK